MEIYKQKYILLWNEIKITKRNINENERKIMGLTKYQHLYLRSVWGQIKNYTEN